MDWWQILYSFIGGFLGFGFALLTESLFEKNKRKKCTERLINNLNDELKYVHAAYSDEFGNVKPRTFFDIPIWTSVVSTGDLLFLQKRDEKYYKAILEIYSKVVALIQMEAEKEDSDLIFKSKSNIIKLINNLLKIN